MAKFICKLPVKKLYVGKVATSVTFTDNQFETSDKDLIKALKKAHGVIEVQAKSAAPAAPATATAR